MELIRNSLTPTFLAKSLFPYSEKIQILRSENNISVVNGPEGLLDIYLATQYYIIHCIPYKLYIGCSKTTHHTVWRIDDGDEDAFEKFLNWLDTNQVCWANDDVQTKYFVNVKEIGEVQVRDGNTFTVVNSQGYIVKEYSVTMTATNGYLTFKRVNNPAVCKQVNRVDFNPVDTALTIGGLMCTVNLDYFCN